MLNEFRLDFGFESFQTKSFFEEAGSFMSVYIH